MKTIIIRYVERDYKINWDCRPCKINYRCLRSLIIVSLKFKIVLSQYYINNMGFNEVTYTNNINI